MSIDLGHSKGYIQSISSGRALPSMNEFLYICDYFGITPFEFFDEKEENILMIKELFNETSNMDKDDLSLLTAIAKRLSKY